ncbi:hypothetical protein FA15DRAFT_671215 [Coprinopsis marcescibilis]|uniref:Uncharacterized protein n=1 Tax=Coprinopsis marcescibilis TaxID=230819 RepID=A0A5C3KQV1_COPMA|nr:hypothetical protein FA15DRAFT_671215 [Coprinopsis marcescibilis]
MEGKSSESVATTPFSLVHARDPASSNPGRDYFDLKPRAAVSEALRLCEDIAVSALCSEERASRSPIDHIPNEILAHVCELAYFSELGRDDCTRSALFRVSRRLHDIVDSTPSIWSVYALSQGNLERYLHVMPIHLQRSRGHPLDITLNCFWAPEKTKDVMDLLVPHSQRWQHLSITTPNTDVFSFLFNASAPMLKSVTFCHFSTARRLALPGQPLFLGNVPNISTLSLRNVGLDTIHFPIRHLTKLELRGYGRWPEYTVLHDLLAGSESLQHFIIHVKSHQVLEDIHRPHHEPPILLPALKTLEVITSEWLTPSVTQLIRTFSYPNLKSLIVREGPRSGVTAQDDIVRYSAGPNPRLSIYCANMDLAYRCLSKEQLDNINILELRKAIWPTRYIMLRDLFDSMPVLENLVISELNTVTTMEELKPEMELHGRLEIPSLLSLDVDVLRNMWATQSQELAHFFQLFHLTSLNSLFLRNISSDEWKRLLATFHKHMDDYPYLTSLSLTHMHEISLGLTDDASGSANVPTPADAFPHLRHLSLLNVPSNPILEHLLTESDVKECTAIPWPDLHSITLCGSTFTNNHLLHRLVTERNKINHPISRLLLDPDGSQ